MGWVGERNGEPKYSPLSYLFDGLDWNKVEGERAEDDGECGDKKEEFKFKIRKRERIGERR